jgi:hypothetical protein
MHSTLKINPWSGFIGPENIDRNINNGVGWKEVAAEGVLNMLARVNRQSINNDRGTHRGKRGQKCS